LYGTYLVSTNPPIRRVDSSFKALKCNLTTSFIPGGTTGFIQVCDTVINKSLKDRIKELADQIDEHEREWVEGKYPVSQRRVLLTKWVGQAWEDMHAQDSDMIRQAFVQVGLGLPIDGSRDHEINIKDFPDVQVGNWRDWQPREARKEEDIQSNLTPEEVEILASSMPVDDSDDIIDSGETIIVDIE
jgi:hypothetical protein